MLAKVIRRTDAEEQGNLEMRPVPGNVAANECGEFKNFPAIFNRLLQKQNLEFGSNWSL